MAYESLFQTNGRGKIVNSLVGKILSSGTQVLFSSSSSKNKCYWQLCHIILMLIIIVVTFKISEGKNYASSLSHVDV